jgi:hypothetical protein
MMSDQSYYMQRHEAWLREKETKEKEKKRVLAPKRIRSYKLHPKDIRIMDNGIKVTLMLRGTGGHFLRKNRALSDKLHDAATQLSEKSSRVFYTSVDLPDSKTSIILEAVYMGGVTVAYHKQTGNVFVRPNGECWYMMD